MTDPRPPDGRPAQVDLEALTYAAEGDGSVWVPKAHLRSLVGECDRLREENKRLSRELSDAILDATHLEANAKIRAELHGLRAKVRELEADRERLDWLDSTREWTSPCVDPDGVWFLCSHDDRDDAEGDSIRAAIDAARRDSSEEAGQAGQEEGVNVTTSKTVVFGDDPEEIGEPRSGTDTRMRPGSEAPDA